MNHFHAVIFDAGSSGTRPFIYRISREVVDDNGIIRQRAQVVELINHDGRSLKVSERGIHEVDHADIAAHLDPLFEEVEGVLTCSGVVLPIKYYFYATGGVRDNLNEQQRNNLRVEVQAYFEVMQEIADADYEYRPISGSDEAKYGWVAAHRSLGRPYNAGYVELGGATVQIAFPLPDDAGVLALAEGIAANLDSVMVVGVGHQNLFLASYPLGSKTGYDKYQEVLLNRGGDPDIDLKGEAEGNQQIFFDPSMRQGSPEKVDGVNTIRFRPAGGLQGPESNPAKTMKLTLLAVNELFPVAAITQPLDNVLGQLHVIGASNFWHTMKGALNDAGVVTPAMLNQAMRNDIEKTHAEMEAELTAMPAGEREFMRPILERSILTTRWTLRALRQAFGVPLDGRAGVTFTPYNGTGDDRNRFSWTLGTAVLLASPAPTDLVAAVRAIRVPAA